ncbi:MAG: FtsX-like permease family protein [Arenicellales bacterium]
MLLALAWRNIWRQPRRTLLNVSSIAFAAMIMVFLLSFQLGTYATMKENVLRVMDGFAQVQPPGYQDDPQIKRTIGDPDAVLARIESRDDLRAAPRGRSFAILSDGEKSFGAAVVGVDPRREVRVSTLANTVRKGRYLAPGDDNAVVLGSALARNLGVAPGDTVSMLGQARDSGIAADVLEVVGVFDTGTPELDRQVAEVPLKRFQATFGMGKAVNVIALAAPALADVTNALPGLRRELAGHRLVLRSWRELEPGLAAAITLDLGTSMLWYASLVIVVVFIILNTLLMSVLERTHEFGVLLAIGMRPGSLGAMIWLELGLLALVGLAAGIALGSAVTLAVAHYGLEMPGSEAMFAQWGLPGKLFPHLSVLSACAGPAVMAACILLAGIFPYRRAGALEPVAAMRAV